MTISFQLPTSTGKKMDDLPMLIAERRSRNSSLKGKKNAHTDEVEITKFET